MARAHTIVMAGGSGTRFWPLSRRTRPKQLLALAGENESLLAATVRRAGATSALSDIVVVTSEALGPATRAELPDLPRQNILLEPIGRNTAACIGWATGRIAREDPDAVCVVVPADHHIRDERRYAATLSHAIDVALDGGIVTVGILPTRAETGYGYIELGESLGGEATHRASRFVEKPDAETAARFLAGKNHLWNGGIFVFRASVMLENIRLHLPALHAGLDKISCTSADDVDALRSVYESLESISIDHGVMERAADVRVVSGDFGWSDLGSFESAWELAAKDEHGNTQRADAVLIDAGDCYVSAPSGKVVALVGVTDLVVVDTGDALLVMKKSRSEDIRAVVAALEARDDERR